MRKVLYFLLFYIVSFWGPAKAQDDSGPVRVEFEAGADVFQLVPCGELGALMFYESVKQTDETNKAWVFIFYDTALEANWSREIPVVKGLGFVKSHVVGEDVFLLFQNSSKSRNDVYNMQLLHINVAKNDFQQTGIFIPEKARLVNFEVAGDMAVFGLNYWKEKTLVLIKNLKTNREIKIDFTENPTFLEDIRFDKKGTLIFAVLNVYSSRKKSALYLNTYTTAGEMRNSIGIIPGHEMVKLMNAKLTPDEGETVYLLGTYNHLNGKLSRSEEEDQEEESEGFYISKVTKAGVKFIKLYDLLDFKNITEILNNEELKDISNIINKNNKKNKNEPVYYDFLIHDLIHTDDEFIMLAEAYYPEYHQISTMSYDFYGRPVPYYYTVFDGYKYFNAFVVSFDKNGKLNWSNGMKIWNMLLMKLVKVVEVYKDSNDVVLFYNYKGNVVSKVINRYSKIGEVEQTKIVTGHPDDVQIDSGVGMIRHWYGKYFIAYGYQTLRNSTLSGGSKRKVFYINKLAYD